MSNGQAAWRYVDLGAVDAFESNSQLPVIARSVAERALPTVTTSIWGRTHLNVGWFDDVDATVDLEAAARLGVQVIRRPFYGGGTAFYGERCAATWAFLIPKAEGPDPSPSLDEHLSRFQPVVLDTLGRIGLGEVVFEGSSDLRWNGRKIGALTAQDVVACDSVGGFLNLAPPDLDLYLAVARIPEEKFRDKVVKDLRSYVVTAQEIAGHPVSYEEFRRALLDSIGAAGIRLEAEGLSEEESSRLGRNAAKIADDDWVRRVSSERFRRAAPAGSRVGFANHKGRKLCRAGVAVDASGVMVSAMLAGDMHVSPPDVLDRTSAALAGADVGDREKLRARISSVFDGADVHQADALMGVTTEDLLTAVEAAVRCAET